MRYQYQKHQQQHPPVGSLSWDNDSVCESQNSACNIMLRDFKSRDCSKGISPLPSDLTSSEDDKYKNRLRALEHFMEKKKRSNNINRANNNTTTTEPASLTTGEFYLKRFLL